MYFHSRFSFLSKNEIRLEFTVVGAIASMKLKNILKREKIKSFNNDCYNGFGFHYAVYLLCRYLKEWFV